MERAYERLLRYAAVPTASDEESGTCPSCADELDLARLLEKELKEMGARNVTLDENGYLFAEIPATAPGRQTAGFIAHVDTVRCVPWKDIKTNLIPDYDGKDIVLENGDTVTVASCPQLARHRGKTMLVTDGRTLLGADDKAGVAEIMCMAQRLLAQDAPPHGRVILGFTPDEEIGRGADRFDVARFGADYAYTVDGGELGEVNFETFNAADGIVTARGVSTHPGSAKGAMVNAANAVADFAALLPAQERAETTEGREGFYHLCGISGECESARAVYIIRDHDRERFERRKDYFIKAAQLINARYGCGVLAAEVKDSYYNMAQVLADRPYILGLAKEAFRANGIEPRVEPVRGGTDGSRLSFMGLPCPNLSCCGINAHGRHEMVPVEDMDRMADVLVTLACMAPEADKA